jgi:hypothetical protein
MAGRLFKLFWNAIKEPNDKMDEEHKIIHNAEHFPVKKYISTNQIII